MIVEKIVLYIPCATGDVPCGTGRQSVDAPCSTDCQSVDAPCGTGRRSGNGARAKGVLTDRYTDWLFGTAALKDRHVQPVILHCPGPLCTSEELKAELTERTVLLNCHSFRSDRSDVDVCIGYKKRGWSTPEMGFALRAAEHFRSRGYESKLNNPFPATFPPRMDFDYPSMTIAVNERAYLDENGELDMQKAWTLQEAIEDLYHMILYSADNLDRLYMAEFPLLYAGRKRIMSDPAMASVKADLGFYAYGDVRLGEYLAAVEANPDLFADARDDKWRLATFDGSPFSGLSYGYFVNIDTGERKRERICGYMKKVARIDAIRPSIPRLAHPTLSLHDVIDTLRLERAEG